MAVHPRHQTRDKPAFARLNPAHPLGRDIFGCWPMNELGSTTRVSSYGRGSKWFYDIGPYEYHCYYGTAADQKYITSPYGSAVRFDTGNYGQVTNTMCQYLDGAPGLTIQGIIRRRAAGEYDYIASFGLFGTSTTKFELYFDTSNRIYWKTRTQIEGAQGIITTATFPDPDAWYHVVATANPISGGGEYNIWVDGIKYGGTGTPNHASDTYDGAYGGWSNRIGNLGYTQAAWYPADMAVCTMWKRALLDDEVAMLYDDPFGYMRQPERRSLYAAQFTTAPPAAPTGPANVIGETSKRNRRHLVYRWRYEHHWKRIR